MENIMKPEPHQDRKCYPSDCGRDLRSCACDKDHGYGQFFQLSRRKSERRRSLSVEKDRVMWNLPSVKSDD